MMPLKSFFSWRWFLLAAVVVGAAALRSGHLADVFLWVDETDFFNDKIFGNSPQPLLQYAIETRDATTNTWGWPAILWVTCRIFGTTLKIARTPGMIAGTAMVLAMFFLIYRILGPSFPGNRYVPALAGSVLAAIAMPQMEFSQRTYPYAAAPFAGAAVLLVHLHLYRVLTESELAATRLRTAMAWYTAIVSFAICIHPSLNILAALSLLFLAIEIRRLWPGTAAVVRKQTLRWSVSGAAIILAFVLLNRKNPKFGYRPYLVQYYHPASLRSIPKILFHLYDLGTYHLNLFYNPALYWPERLNILILPLVILCVAGWWLAAARKFGPLARQLARLGGAVVTVIAALSFFKLFPFGGVRQTLFLSPFLLAFTVLGIYSLCANRTTRAFAIAMATAYVCLWGINLPKFYEDRLVTYDRAEIVADWAEAGKLNVYCWYCYDAISYVVRDYPELSVVKQLPKAPFLLIANRTSIQNQPRLNEDLIKFGYTATLVDERPAKHPESLHYSGSLYFPPSGLWVYVVTNDPNLSAGILSPSSQASPVF